MRSGLSAGLGLLLLCAGPACAKRRVEGPPSGPGAAGPLAITSLAPVSGPVVGGTVVTISGSGFESGAGVTFGGTTAFVVTVLSSTRIAATTPAHAAGSADVTVTNPTLATTTATNAFTFVSGLAPAPVITTLSPVSGPVAGGTTVTLTGSGFQTGATVSVAGTGATSVTVLTASLVTFVTPAGTAGPATVVLLNPDSQTATATNGFTYGTAAPTVTAVTPAVGPLAGGTVVTIAGSGYQPTPTVTIGGVACTAVQVQTAGSLVCTTGAGTVAGPATVTVTNPNTQFGSLAGGFTYQGTAPTVTGIAPAGGPPAGGGSVTLTGTGFVTGATVTFGSNAATVGTLSATQVVVTAPAGSVGTVTVTLTNPDAQTAGTTYTYNPAPTITGIAPNNGPLAGGGTVTLTGTGFLTGATVTFGGANATVTALAATAVEVTAPAGSAGTVTVTLTNTDGQAATTSYTYNAAPTISGISPTNGAPGGSNTVTLTGTGFLTGATVTFGGASATVVGLAAGQITVTAPVGSVGTVTVTVTNPDGQAATTSYTYNAAPTITGIAPSNGAPAGTNTVTITGTGFLTGATVSFGGASATVTALTATQLDVTAPSGSVGTVTVTATNPDGQAATTSYTYNAAPAITGISPTNGAPGGSNTVTLTGTGFLTGATVTFGGTGATVVAFTATQLDVTAPVGSVGTVTVTVTNPDGQAATTSYTYNAAPTISGISPTSGAPGGSNTVTITGTGFLTGATVTFGGTSATVLSLVAGQISVTAPAGSVGTVTVTVTNPDGQAATTSYTYNPAPTITGISPTNGVLAGGNTVTLAGTGFLSGATVTFGGANATVTAFSATAIEVTAPAGSAGTVTVTLTNPDGQVATTSYTYNPAPTISGITPANGVQAGGNAVTLTGSGYLTGATVTFGATSATVSGLTATQVVVTAPSAATPGTVTVTLTNPDGQAATTSYTYNAAPVITGIAPSSGAQAGGNPVTITGSAFQTGATVTFASTIATVTSNAPTQVVVTAPASVTSGNVTVTLTNPDAQAATTSYTYLTGPVVTGVAPSNGAPAGGNAVTITGVNFSLSATVTFGGSTASITTQSATQIVVTAPSGSVGTVTVTVTNPGPQTATGSYTYNPAPTISAIAPAAGPTAGGNPVTLTGTGFLTGATVTFAAGGATVTALTATQLDVTAPAGSAGSVTVTVTNPDGQSATTSYLYSNTGPTLSTVAPATGPETGGTLVTLTGTNYQNGATVTFGGVASPTVGFVSGTTLTAVTPAGAPGSVTVVVTNPNTLAGSLAGGFTYVAVQTQVLTGLTDWLAQQGSGVDLQATPGDVRLARRAGSFFADGTVITAVAYHHAGAVPTRMLVGTNSAGAFLTTDGGATWTPFNLYTAPPLPTNRVLSVGFFSGGNGGNTFLIGTSAGAVLTTDGGATFRVYDTLSNPALPANQVDAVAFHDGSTLGARFLLATNAGFGGPGGAVLTMDGGNTFTTWNAASTPAIGTNWVRAADFFDPDATGNTFLIGVYSSNTQGGGVYHTTTGGATFTRYHNSSVPSTPGNGVRAVSFFQGNTVGDTWMVALDSYLGGGGGAIQTTNGGNGFKRWDTTSSPALASNDAACCAQSLNVNRLVIGLDANGLAYSVNGGTGGSGLTALTTVTSPALLDSGVRSVDWFRGNTATFLVGCGTKLTGVAPTVRGGTQQTTTTGATLVPLALPNPDELGNDNVRAVAVFRGNGTGSRVLVGTSQGAVLTTDGGTTWQRFTTTSSPALPSDDVRSVAWYEGDATGQRFLLGTAGGVVRSTDGGGSFTTFTTTQGLPSNDVRAVAWFSGDTTSTARFLVGTGAGAALTTNGGTGFTTFTTGSSPALPSNTVQGVAFFDGNTTGSTFLIATSGGLVHSTNGGTGLNTYTAPTIVHNNVRACAFFHGDTTGATFLSGTFGGASRTANGGVSFQPYTFASGLPSNNVVAVAYFSGGTAGTRFALACAGGGLALTSDGGTTFTVRNALSSPRFPDSDVSAVDYDDSVATGDRYVAGIPSVTAIATGGVFYAQGTTFFSNGSLVVGSVDGGVIPVAAPLPPTWDDQGLRGVDFFDGDTTAARFVLGGLYGAARTADGGTTFAAFGEASSPALADGHVRAVAMFGGDTLGQTFALATAAGAYVTTNGGTTFSAFTTGNGLPGNDVRAVAFHDGTAAGARFVIATANGVAFTSNGGSTFTIRNSLSTPALPDDCRGVDFHDGTSTGARWAVATAAGVVHTEDGGSSFTTRSAAGGLPGNDVRGVVYWTGDTTGRTWLAATQAGGAFAGGVAHTTDNGATFLVRNTTTTPALPSAFAHAVDYFQGATVAGTWLVGHAAGVTATTDNGSTFTTRTTANGLPANDTRAVAYASGVAGGATRWLAGTAGGAALTTNGGAAWSAFRRGTCSGYLHANVTETIPANTAIRYQVLDGTGALVPDAVMPGNSAGLVPDGSGNLDLTAVPIGTYPTLQLRANLSTTVTSLTPVLHEVRIRYRY